MKKNEVLKAFSALFIAGAVLSTAVNVNAASTSTVTVPSSSFADQDVTASFEITDAILQDLGYGAYVSVPLSVSLTYDSSSKKFTGTMSYYAAGVIDDGYKVSIKVDSANSGYGYVTDSKDNSYYVKNKDGFAVNLSVAEFSKSDMSRNLTFVEAENYDNVVSGVLSVSIPGKGFVPKVTGKFESLVPLTIKKEAE